MSEVNPGDFGHELAEARQLREAIMQRGNELFDMATSLQEIKRAGFDLHGRYVIGVANEITEFPARRIKIVPQDFDTNREEIAKLKREKPVDKIFLYQPSVPGLFYRNGQAKLLIGRNILHDGVVDQYAITRRQYLVYPEGKQLLLPLDALNSSGPDDRDLGDISVDYSKDTFEEFNDLDADQLEKIKQHLPDVIQPQIGITVVDMLAHTLRLWDNYELLPQTEREDV